MTAKELNLQYHQALDEAKQFIITNNLNAVAAKAHREQVEKQYESQLRALRLADVHARKQKRELNKQAGK